MKFKAILSHYPIGDFKAVRVISRRKGRAVRFNVLGFGTKEEALKKINEAVYDDVMLIPPFKEEEDCFVMDALPSDVARFLREYNGWSFN